MIKILAISGSPVEGSSTDYLLLKMGSAIINALKPVHQTEMDFVKLTGQNTIPCQACGFSPAPKFCIFDDLNEIYDKIIACDCLLFGSPVYFDSVSAQAKLLIDRCNCFRPADFDNSDPEHLFLKRLTRKRPGAMIIVGGENGWFEGARRVIAGFFKWIEISNEGAVFYGSPDYNKKGTAADDEDAIAKAEALGGKLAAILIERASGSA